MSTISEGTLSFTFPKDWLAVKYDKTIFYRNSVERLGAEMCAVDIIASPGIASSKLILIEIKDLRGHAAENRKRIASRDLAIEVINKAVDTATALFLGVRANNPELRVFRDLLTPDLQQLEVVLFMEEDAIPVTKPLELVNQKRKREDLTLTLRSKLKAAFNIKASVRAINTMEARDGWSAS